MPANGRRHSLANQELYGKSRFLCLRSPKKPKYQELINIKKNRILYLIYYFLNFIVYICSVYSRYVVRKQGLRREKSVRRPCLITESGIEIRQTDLLKNTLTN